MQFGRFRLSYYHMNFLVNYLDANKSVNFTENYNDFSRVPP